MPRLRSTSTLRSASASEIRSPVAGDQTEQRLEDDPAQARRRAKPPCGGQQIDDLLLAVDVRRLPLRQASEDRVVGNLGARLELLQPARERAQLLQPPRPGVRVTAAVAVASGPVGHDLHRQWSAMADGTERGARSCARRKPGCADEAQAATLDQVALDARVQGWWPRS